MSEAKIVLSAENRTRAAFAALRGDVEATQQRISGFQGVLATGLALAPVAAFTAGMSRAIGELDRLGDQGPKIGLTAQGLAELGYTANLSGTNAETLEGAIGKLSVKMSDAAGGSKEAARGFEALGIKVTDATGKLKASDVMLGELADKFAKMNDGPAKTAMAIELFGRSGKELIPMLSQGSSGINTLREEFVRLTGGPITEAVEQAQQFRDQMDRLTTKSQGFYIHIAGEVLPILNVLAEQMVGTGAEADKLSGNVGKVSTSAEIVRTVLEAVTVVGADVAYVFKGMGTEIGGLAAQMAALLTLDFKGFKAIGAAMKEDADKARQAIDDYQNRILNAKTLDRIKKSADELEKAFFGGDRKKDAPILGAAAAKEAESEYEKLISRIRMRITLADEELKKGRALTDEEKFAAQIAEDIAKAKGKLSATERESLALMVQTSAQRNRALTDERESIALRKAAAEADRSALLAEAQIVEKRVEGLTESNKQIKEEIAVLGLSKQQLIEHESALIADAIAEKEAELARMDAAGTTTRRSSALRVEIELLRERKDLVRRKGEGEIAVEEAEKAREAWKKTTDEINDKLTDALMRGFEDGKDFATNFRDTLVNMFKTLVLRPVISAILSPVATGISNMLGTTLAPAAGSAAGSVLGGGNLLSGATTLLGGGMGAFTQAAGATMTNGMISGFGANMANVGTLAGGGQMMGALGAAAPYLAAIAAVIMIAKSMKGETRAGGGYDYTPGVGYTKQTGPSGGDPYQKEAKTIIESTTASLNNLLSGLGSSTRVGDLHGAYEGSEKGRGGVMVGGRLTNGMTFGEEWAGSNYSGGFFENTSAKTLSAGDAFQNFVTDSYQAQVQALQTISGLLGKMEEREVRSTVLQSGGEGGDTFTDVVEKVLVQTMDEAAIAAAEAASGIPEAIRKRLRGVNAEALTQDEAQALVTSITVQIEAVKNFRSVVATLPFENLKTLSFDAADGLLSLTGGIEGLTGSLNSYLQNFYSDSERRQLTVDNLSKTFGDLGLTLPKTREAFRGLVESQDLTTESGRNVYATLLRVADAFAQVQPAAEAAAAGAATMKTAAEQQQDAIDTAFKVLKASVDAERASIDKTYNDAVDAANVRIDALGDSIDKLTGLSDSLVSTLSRFRTDAVLGMDRGAASAQIQAALAIAKASGVLPEADSLRDALTVIGQPSEDLYRSFVDYATAFDEQVGTLNELNELTDGQLDAQTRALKLQEQEVDALRLYHDASLSRLDAIVTGAQAQIDAINGNGQIVATTVAQALQQFAAAVGRGGGTGAAAAAGGGGGGSGAGGAITGTQAIANLYESLLDRPADVGGLNFWTEKLYSGQLDLAQIAQEMQKSPEYLASRGYSTGGMTSGLIRVGEDGPELLDLDTPGRIYSASQTRGMSAGGMSASAAVEQLLRSILAEMENGNFAIAHAALRAAKVLEQWDGDGMPEEREIA